MTNEEIQAIYLQECEEGLASAEASLLEIKSGQYDAETINTIFRSVHSIKGGAGAFGFADLQSFTHHFETLLDKVRDGDVAITQPLVDVLIAAFDILTDHVGAIRGDCETPDDAGMLQSLQDAAVSAVTDEADGVSETEAQAAPAADFMADLGINLGFDLAAMMSEMTDMAEELAPDEEVYEAEAGPEIAAPETPVSETQASNTPTETISSGAEVSDSDDQAEDWVLRFAPTSADMMHGSDPLLLVRELLHMGGQIHLVDLEGLPTIDQFDADEAYVGWTVVLPHHVEEVRIREIFDFVSDAESVLLTRGHVMPPAPPADIRPDLPASAAGIEPITKAAPISAPRAEAAKIIPIAAPSADAGPIAAAPAAKTTTMPASTTIRVELEKLDRLVNLVGELVITQSMLSQRLMGSGSEDIQELTDLDHLTRELQDSAMALRAQPVKSVFSRVPRIVRELEASTGKRVILEVEGETTELDKTVIERIGEPLTHLIRNCIDHGIEMPEERVAKGKAAEGTVRLVAEHKSGRIVISVSDDGAGINRERVLAIAVERGIVSPDMRLSDEEIDNLIFAPGFSTAKTVSNISGRGVGMDVVRQSVHALGGRVTIESRPGLGSLFTLALPLTLAIADGMIVSVGDETFVVPLTHVIESLRPESGAVQRTGFGNDVLNVRGAYLPVLSVGNQMNVTGAISEPSQAVLIIVDTEASGQAILMVDAIVDQRQVVIKSLETHYQQVEGVSGATILGDGRVALILDVETLVALRANSAPRLWAC